VLLAGGGWSDRRSLLPLAPSLHAGGYGVLAFDYREHGLSDGSGRGTSFGWRESRDVEAAARFLKTERDAARVAAVGYSIGGAAAILAAADDPGIDAVVASTPGTTLRDLLATVPETRDVPAWQRELVVRVLLLRIGAPLRSVVSGEIGPLYAVDRLAPRPLLLLHGRDDPINAVADAQRLLARARPPRQLLIVGGAGHLDVLDDPHSEAQQQILRFLDTRFCPGN
jgi:pimeloyl-ACP methyl ester carboxylesterase